MAELEKTIEEEKTEWVLISQNEPLNPGDRIRMYYSIIGPTYFQAAQIAAIEERLETHPEFTLIRTSLPTEGGALHDIWFEILIKKPPPDRPQIQQANVGIIHAVIVGIFTIWSVFCWLTLREVRLYVQEPGEIKEVIKETGWTAVKIGAAAIVAVIALKWWGKK